MPISQDNVNEMNKHSMKVLDKNTTKDPINENEDNVIGQQDYENPNNKNQDSENQCSENQDKSSEKQNNNNERKSNESDKISPIFSITLPFEGQIII